MGKRYVRLRDFLSRAKASGISTASLFGHTAGDFFEINGFDDAWLYYCLGGRNDKVSIRNWTVNKVEPFPTQKRRLGPRKIGVVHITYRSE